jgi:FtsH ternary system domain X3-analog
MAEMTIRLRIDPNTGKKDIVVSLSSDADALPHEHEEQHRKLVEKLIEGGLVKPSELGQIIVERVEERQEPGASANQPEEPLRTKQGQGS